MEILNFLYKWGGKVVDIEDVQYMIELPLLSTGKITGIFTRENTIYITTTDPYGASELIPEKISGYNVEIIQTTDIVAL